MLLIGRTRHKRTVLVSLTLEPTAEDTMIELHGLRALTFVEIDVGTNHGANLIKGGRCFIQINMVFQAILEALLKRYLGKYLVGLDQSNLTFKLTDGSVSLKHVHIQKQLFEDLNLPIQLICGRVQNVLLQYPWWKGKSKLTVLIQNCSALIRPKQNFSKEFTRILIKGKLRAISNRIAQRLRSLNQETKGQSSFAVNYIKKILRNVEIKIKNIHIRYEYQNLQSGQSLSLGICLGELIFQTVDKEGNKIFFEEDSAQVNQLIQNLELNNLIVYLNTSQKDIFSNSAVNQILFSKLIEFRPQHSSSLLDINLLLTLRSILKNNSYQLQLALKTITLHINYQQFFYLKRITSLFLEFQKGLMRKQNQLQIYVKKMFSFQLIRQKMGQVKLMQRGQSRQHIEQELKKLFNQYLRWGFWLVYMQKKQKKFTKILQNLDKEGLLQSVRQIGFKNALKRLKFPNHIKAYKMLDKTMRLITNTPQEFILNWIDLYFTKESSRNFHSDEIKKGITAILTEKVWAQCRATIQKIQIIMLDNKHNGAQVLIQKTFFDLTVMDQNKLNAKTAMSDLKINLLEKWGTRDFVRVPIFKRANFSSKQLFSAQITKNPQQSVFYKIQAQLQSVQLIFTTAQVKRLLEILFDLQQLKGQSTFVPQQNDLDLIKKSAYLRNILCIKIDCPFILIPYTDHNNQQQECFVVRCGDFSLISSERQQTFYDCYQFMLKNCSVQYYSSISYYRSGQQLSDVVEDIKVKVERLFVQGNSLTVLHKFSAGSELWLIKNYLSFDQSSKFKFKLDANLQNIDIDIDKQILSSIKCLYRRLINDVQATRLPFQHFFVSQIQRDLSLSCKVLLTCKRLTLPTCYYLVMAGTYLYFFLSKFSKHFQLGICVVGGRILWNKMPSFSFQTGKGEEITITLYCKDDYQNLLYTIQSLCESKAISTIYPQQGVRNQDPETYQQKEAARRSFHLIIDRINVNLHEELLKPFWVRTEARRLELLWVENQFVSSFKLFLKDFLLCKNEQSEEIKIFSNFPFNSSYLNPRNENILELQATPKNQKVPIVILVSQLYCTWILKVLQQIRSFLFSVPAQTNQPIKKNQKIITLKVKRFEMICEQEGVRFGRTTCEWFVLQYDCKAQYQSFKVSSAGITIKSIIPDLITILSPLQNAKFQILFRTNQLKQFFNNQMTVHISAYSINYFHEQFNRQLNYLFNSFVGAITTKFIGKPWSTLQQLLVIVQNRKYSSLQLTIDESVCLIPASFNSQTMLSLQIKRAVLQKSLESFTEVQIHGNKTISVLKEFYAFSAPALNLALQTPTLTKPLAQQFWLDLKYSKPGLLPDQDTLFVSPQLFDRSTSLQVNIQRLELSFQRDDFLAILRVFYNNIKHKDGKAAIFDPPIKYSLLRSYSIRIRSLLLNAYAFFDSLRTKFLQVDFSRFNFQFLSQADQSKAEIKSEFVNMQLYREGQLSQFITSQELQEFRLQYQSSPQGNNTSILMKNSAFCLNYPYLKQIIEFFSYQSSSVNLQPSSNSLTSTYTVRLLNSSIQMNGLNQVKIQVQTDLSLIFTKKFEKTLPKLKQGITYLNSQLGDWKELVVNARKMRVTGNKSVFCLIQELEYRKVDYDLSARRFSEQDLNLSKLWIQTQIEGLKDLNSFIRRQFFVKQQRVFTPCKDYVPAASKSFMRTLRIRMADVKLELTGQLDRLSCPLFQVVTKDVQMGGLIEEQGYQFEVQLQLQLSQINDLVFKSIFRPRIKLSFAKRAPQIKLFTCQLKASTPFRLSRHTLSTLDILKSKRVLPLRLKNLVCGFQHQERDFCYAHQFISKQVMRLKSADRQAFSKGGRVICPNLRGILNETWESVWVLGREQQSLLRESEILYMKDFSDFKGIKIRDIYFQYSQSKLSNQQFFLPLGSSFSLLTLRPSFLLQNLTNDSLFVQTPYPFELESMAKRAVLSDTHTVQLRYQSQKVKLIPGRSSTRRQDSWFRMERLVQSNTTRIVCFNVVECEDPTGLVSPLIKIQNERLMIQNTQIQEGEQDLLLPNISINLNRRTLSHPTRYLLTVRPHLTICNYTSLRLKGSLESLILIQPHTISYSAFKAKSTQSITFESGMTIRLQEGQSQLSQGILMTVVEGPYINIYLSSNHPFTVNVINSINPQIGVTAGSLNEEQVQLREGSNSVRLLWRHEQLRVCFERRGVFAQTSVDFRKIQSKEQVRIGETVIEIRKQYRQQVQVYLTHKDLQLKGQKIFNIIVHKLQLQYANQQHLLTLSLPYLSAQLADTDSLNLNLLLSQLDLNLDRHTLLSFPRGLDINVNAINTQINNIEIRIRVMQLTLTDENIGHLSDMLAQVEPQKKQKSKKRILAVRKAILRDSQIIFSYQSNYNEDRKPLTRFNKYIKFLPEVREANFKTQALAITNQVNVFPFFKGIISEWLKKQLLQNKGEVLNQVNSFSFQIAAVSRIINFFRRK